MKITHLHSGGQTTFESEDIKAYGSLDNLIASDILPGIHDREASLASLWAGANQPPVDWDAIEAEEQARDASGQEVEAEQAEQGAEEGAAML